MNVKKRAIKRPFMQIRAHGIKAASPGLTRQWTAERRIPPKPERPLTAVEREYLEMARHENVRTALGTFHQPPGDVFWEGYARLQKA
jgi:hypothetical protein